MSWFTDKHLLYQISTQHQPEAFDTLYLRYIDKIHRFMAFRVSQPEDADDLTAEVFSKTWQYLTKNDPEEIRSFQAFIYKIARNTVANFYRAQGKIPHIMDINDPEEYLEVKDEQEDMLKKSLRAQEVDDLIANVQLLKEPWREVIALRFFEELDINEIAEIMEQTPGYVRVIIHRGIKELQKIMGSQSI